MNIISDELAPGARAALIGLVKAGERVEAVNMDPASAARFVVERVDRLTAGEVSAHTSGRYRAPGCLVQIRNTSSQRARFRAHVVGGPDAERLEREIVRAADDAWKRGGDPITEAEARRAGEASR